MKNSGFANLQWQMKILWCLMLALSVAAAGFSGYQITFLSFSQMLILALALPVSFLIAGHRIKIPGFPSKISARETVVFWAILWLGAGGAFFLAANCLAEKLRNRKDDRCRAIYEVNSSLTATFLAANIFYLILHRFFDFTGNTVGENLIHPGHLLAAFALLVLLGAFLVSIPNILFDKFEDEMPTQDNWKRKFFSAATLFGFGGAAALGVHFLFTYFGLAFGLVIIPLIIAAHFAYCIHERRLQQKIGEIGEAGRVHLATVEALATAIDARDQVGVGHVRRTQIYAIGIGKKLDLPEDEINALRTGALLHDIGKLAVPDHILNKPGRLTPAEMEKIKIHASVGASILEKVGFSYPVVPTVKYHHEAWDGSGYPDGLIGESIPLTARILAVADAYDTLRGARPYRGAVLRDEARRFLLNGAGTQFDGKVVDVFLRNLRKFETEIEAGGLSYLRDDEGTVKFSQFSESGDQSYVEQIKRANHEVFTLYELAKVFSSSLNLHQTLSLFAGKIGEFIPFDTCAIYLLDPSEETAVVVYAEGKNSQPLKNKRIRIGEGATGYVLKNRKPVQNINPGLDFSFSQFDSAQEYTSMVSLPLITEEKLIGAVSLYSCELEAYEEEHLRLLETVSRIAADAISKSLEHAETETRAMTDPMTNLPNARALQIQYEKEMARADRTESNFQVLMLDLDGFKAVNDTFGHKTGDRLLKEISKVMRGQLRDYDFLARYAGDEFVAVIPETDAQGVGELCDRIEKAVKEFRLPISEGLFARVGVSLGAASYPQDGNNFDQMVISADKAMYSVKSIRKQQQKQQQIKLQTTAMSIVPAQSFAGENSIHNISERDLIAEKTDDNFIVEVDESHIISSAIN